MSVRTSGTCHARSGPHKPHNSLYMIDDRGGIVDRCDKTFCGPGVHLGVFEIGRVRCGALICHDYRYPELYREYKRRGVQLAFHSYHAGNIPSETFKAMRKQVGAENRRFNTEGTIPGITTLATMIAEAANNHVWISCPNS
jgi:deaminated glutathione amidase